jgi:zinc/manganese transport system substrate-binding protein
VVTVDQWGDIVSDLAGACGEVTTIIKSSSIDPHDYEPTPADSAKFDRAKLVVVNGLDYDPVG